MSTSTVQCLESLGLVTSLSGTHGGRSVVWVLGDTVLFPCVLLPWCAQSLPYELLMRQLDISNVRELEDLLINDCMYAGIAKGKLDQQRRCFEVRVAPNAGQEPL